MCLVPKRHLTSVTVYEFFSVPHTHSHLVSIILTSCYYYGFLSVSLVSSQSVSVFWVCQDYSCRMSRVLPDFHVVSLPPFCLYLPLSSPGMESDSPTPPGEGANESGRDEPPPPGMEELPPGEGMSHVLLTGSIVCWYKL